ncbi:hypothetical protein [Saccharopolyspora gloriosae]|uniref:hypothetical protein n=1 Tax=Saccharopolyspora gloriosae TaxID=455344 RepID=UPI001FB74272|nr:hypothetical protein [Saccharopolyspora gloriosae]
MSSASNTSWSRSKTPPIPQSPPAGHPGTEPQHLRPPVVQRADVTPETIYRRWGDLQ